MTDSPSPVLQLRIQSVGSNVNLWGGYINTDLAMIEQAAKGYQTLVVTGDATINWTNYATGNAGAAARLKLTGAPPAAATLTFPAYHNFVSVENAASQTVTIRCSGGTGVAIPAGQKALLYCDGADYYNAAPTRLGSGDVAISGKINGVAAGTAATDAVNKTQMEVAIANAALPATAGTVRNSLSDTTSDYLSGKIAAVAGGGLVFSTDNPGGDESAAGALDLNSMTAETAPADADVVALYDASVTAHRKMTLQNMLVVGWGTAAAVDPTADYALIYDTSAAALKKTLVSTIADEGNLILSCQVFS